jgi:hypothetical protein
MGKPDSIRSGLQPHRRERLRLGIIERLAARKPGDPLGGDHRR